MNVVFDENAGGKRLLKVCLSEGLASCRKLPHKLLSQSDVLVLEYIIEENVVLFTLDRTIYANHGRVLAGRNPGIVILRQDDDVLKQVNSRNAREYLASFKTAFPSWHTLPYRHSVVEVTPSLVFVFHTLFGQPVQTWWGKRTGDNWQSSLAAHLEANAEGSPLVSGVRRHENP